MLRINIALVLAVCPLLAQTDLQPRTLANWPTNIVNLSALLPASHATSGCNWLTGLKTGGAACFDDGATINTWLAANCTAAKSCQLTLDISAATSVPIAVPAYTSIVGLSSTGTGLVALAGHNITVLCSKSIADLSQCNGDLPPGTPPSQTGSVTLRHFGVNGFRGAYPESNSTSSGDLRCDSGTVGWCISIHLANLVSEVIEDVQVYDPPTYGFLADNIGSVQATGIRIYAPTWSANTDGFHMSGPIGRFAFDGVYCHTGDDCIAMNLPEGYGGNSGGGTISNVIYDGSMAGFRTYCGATSYTLGPVVETNLTGTLANHPAVDRAALVRLGYQNNGVTDCIQSVKVTNADVTSQDWTFDTYDPVMADILDPVGDLELTNVRWHGLIGNGTPWLKIEGAVTLSNYTCSQCVIERDAGGSAPDVWAQIPTGATIKRYDCGGCTVVNAIGNSTGALSYGIDLQAGGAITNFPVPPYDPLAPIIFNGNQWSRVTNILGQNGLGYPMASISSCGSAALGTGSLAGSGTITGTPTGSCAAVLTTQVPAPNKFNCQVKNQTHTTSANQIDNTSSTATAATLAGTTVSGDVLNYLCGVQ